MEMKQFRFSDSNLAYLVWNGGEAAAIDGGAAEEILEFCRAGDLVLTLVLNTHEHADHTPGNRQLLEATSARFIPPGKAASEGGVLLGNERLEAAAVPGHTADSIFFRSGDRLFTGDTLFNGTVGNCYTRDWELYFRSLERILDFPDGFRIYAGHDLTEYALGVIDTLDPDNPRLREYRESLDPGDLFTPLGLEKAINPFIRWDDPSLDPLRFSLKLPLDTPFLRWRALMTIH